MGAGKRAPCLKCLSCLNLRTGGQIPSSHVRSWTRLPVTPVLEDRGGVDMDGLLANLCPGSEIVFQGNKVETGRSGHLTLCLLQTYILSPNTGDRQGPGEFRLRLPNTGVGGGHYVRPHSGASQPLQYTTSCPLDSKPCTLSSCWWPEGYTPHTPGLEQL